MNTHCQECGGRNDKGTAGHKNKCSITKNLFCRLCNGRCDRGTAGHKNKCPLVIGLFCQKCGGRVDRGKSGHRTYCQINYESNTKYEIIDVIEEGKVDSEEQLIEKILIGFKRKFY